MISTITKNELVRGLNTWMDRYIADPRAFEAEFETVQLHLAEQSDGVEPTYGQVGADYILQLLAEAPPAAEAA